tara:strand:+ start:367 stop:573 length:207 start_codon:yes stop_codon:yes gene_type:complete
MDNNIKNFFFYSFAFSTGLLIYTIVLFLGYIIFMSDNSSEDEIVSGESSSASKEKISDMDELDCLEDA